MQAKELMIGDWVLHHGKPRQVRYINDRIWWDGSCHNDEIGFTWKEEEWCNVCHSEPVTLTEQILMINGCQRTNNVCYIHKKNSAGVECWLEYRECNKTLFINEVLVPVPVCNVHQLQQVLRICGLNELADNFKVTEEE